MTGRKRGKGMETPGGLVRLIVYLPPEIEGELRDVAHRERRSKSDVIREAVTEHLRRLSNNEGGKTR